MSRPYTIAIKESAVRTVSAGDGVETKLELLNVLPPEAMQAILERELQARGYEKGEGSTWARTDEKGILTEIDAASRQVKVTKKVEHEVTVETTVHVHADRDDDSKAQIAAKQAEGSARARKQLDAQADLEARRLQEQLTRDLEQAVGAKHKELQDIALKVTQEALEVKARSLGEVVSVRKDESGSMTIRIRA